MTQVLVDASLNLADLIDKDAALDTLGGSAWGKSIFKCATQGSGQDLLGMSTLGKALVTAATAAVARGLLGAGAVGEAIFAAATAAAVRTAAGITATGDALVTAASAAAARTALGATAIGAAVFTALDAAAARLSLDVYQRHVYGSGGLVAAPKIWRGLSAATNASGVWTCDISSAGFSSIACITATVLRNNASQIEICATQITSSTNTTVTGVAGRGLGLLALGDTWRLAPSGVTVYVRVEGA